MHILRGWVWSSGRGAQKRQHNCTAWASAMVEVGGDACSPSPPEALGEGGCNGGKGRGMATDGDGTTATAN